ncbi:MAG TPA: HDOD domain-containing protein [Gammaproteobacteria bacterium]|nr:HDOD domain-containing protein [Gammaproteobacteria bacterium]
MKNKKTEEDIINNAAALISPPTIWLRINEVVNAPDSSAHDVANVVMQDTALTGNILRIVNSPVYHFSKRIDTVTRAVSIIGLNDLYSIATAVVASKVFSDIPNQLTNTETFWRHSICTGLIARRLAKQCRVLHIERLYVAGLLHDIGSLLLYGACPEKASEALMIANGDENILYQAENDLFGFNHATLGAHLFHSWKLPQTLINTIAMHHSPAEAGEGVMECAILHVADWLANSSELGSFMQEPATDFVLPQPDILEMVRVDPDNTEELMQGLNEELDATLQILHPGANRKQD